MFPLDYTSLSLIFSVLYVVLIIIDKKEKVNKII